MPHASQLHLQSHVMRVPKKEQGRGALYFISTLPFVHCKFTVYSPRDVNNSLICGGHEFRCVHCSRREASEK